MQPREDRVRDCRLCRGRTPHRYDAEFVTVAPSGDLAIGHQITCQICGGTATQIVGPAPAGTTDADLLQVRHRASHRHNETVTDGKAGCVRLAATRSGSVTGIYRAAEAGLDVGADPWAIVCETHGAICGHRTLRQARRHAPFPAQWCEDCREFRLDERVPCAGTCDACDGVTSGAPDARGGAFTAAHDVARGVQGGVA